MLNIGHSRPVPKPPSILSIYHFYIFLGTPFPIFVSLSLSLTFIHLVISSIIPSLHTCPVFNLLAIKNTNKNQIVYTLSFYIMYLLYPNTTFVDIQAVRTPAPQARNQSWAKHEPNLPWINCGSGLVLN